MSHVLTSETGMIVQRLVRLEETANGLRIAVCWKGLPHSEDILEPLDVMYYDVPQMVERLLLRNNLPLGLAEKPSNILAL